MKEILKNLLLGFLCGTVMMIGTWYVVMEEAVEAGSAHRLDLYWTPTYLWRGEIHLHEGYIWRYNNDGTVDHYKAPPIRRGSFDE